MIGFTTFVVFLIFILLLVMVLCYSSYKSALVKKGMAESDNQYYYNLWHKEVDKTPAPRLYFNRKLKQTKVC